MANEFKLDDKDFKFKMNNIKGNIQILNLNIIRALSTKAIAKVKKYTPVGDTGLLRRSWFIQNEKASKENASAEIVNNVHYANPVEMGHKTRGKTYVAGRFMLKRTMSEIEKISKNVADSEARKFISSHGGD